MKLSIVVPCYNEEEGIPYLVNKLKLLEKNLKNYSLELIFIDDGSIDKTNSLLNEYYKNKKIAKIIKHEKNKNVGAALKTGFKFSTGDLIATIDSDCSYEPIELINMLKLFDKNTDIVVGSPYHPKGRIENAPYYRLFLSKAVTLIYRIITNSKLHTFTTIFRIYNKKVKNIKFKSNDFLAPAEILILALFKGYKIKEYPIISKSRKFGVSKVKVLKVILSHLRLIYHVIKLKLFGVKND